MATPEQVAQFNKDGYLTMENFLDENQVEALKKACRNLVDEMNPEEHHTVFSTQHQTDDDYFMTSGDKIRYFFEEGAFDDEGNLQVDKHRSLNKIGHALHVQEPEFKKVTFDVKIQNICKSFGYVEPRICQSMYIFKQPGIGGEVTPHQDATFLNVTPLKLMGYWIALEDATLQNGCLWFIPGSHKRGIDNDRRMIRNPGKTSRDHPNVIFTNSLQQYDEKDFKSEPVKKGTLVLIDGTVVHKSLPNKSEKSRHIYTFHAYDQNEAEYNKENWLQPTEAYQFPCLYTP